ncbi:MAG: LysR family transcriptional regulator [Deltaproteobacteria bacterium]|nr:MAG: LysR family transcriptional regulator [Deltaproteobacteria bacterium]
MQNDFPSTQLNFHHLRYFWLVAREGHLTRTARALRVSQSALSTQIRELESQLGEPLFDRVGRSLELTEAGRIAFAYAEEIFTSGRLLLAALQGGRDHDDVLRIGAMATLSRNFQDSFLRPLFADGVRMRLVSGTFEHLLARLEAHELDLVLSNQPVRGEAASNFVCRRLARQPVSLVGPPHERRRRFPDDIEGVPLIVPTPDSELRTAFDTVCAQLGVVPEVYAEVDDMALLRLLARDTGALALIPSVVVRDELQAGLLQEHAVIPGLHEVFYAIDVRRRFPHPRLEPLLARTEADILAMEG